MGSRYRRSLEGWRAVYARRPPAAGAPAVGDWSSCCWKPVEGWTLLEAGFGEHVNIHWNRNL